MCCWRTAVTISPTEEIGLSDLDRFEPCSATVASWALVLLVGRAAGCPVLLRLIVIVLLWHGDGDRHLPVEAVDAQSLRSNVVHICALQRLQVVLRFSTAVFSVELHLTLLLFQDAKEILTLGTSHHLLEVLCVDVALGFIG